jgi:SAM-dependent methyltransferase
MTTDATSFAANIERFSGYAGHYDQYRPAPPPALAGVLTRLAKSEHPRLVVDLGCGTALSTRYWAATAGEVIGIDPTADMLRQAEAQTTAANVSYRAGFSHQTGLVDHCADIVTASQSLHWMEPQATFQEAARILRPGGVFAAYDYDWPPTTGVWEAEAAYNLCISQINARERALHLTAGVRRWDKGNHLSRLQASGLFRFTKEITLHSDEVGNADRLIGLLLSQGEAMTLIKAGLTPQELGIDRFTGAVTSSLGTELRPWYWSSRLRVGVV